MVGVFRIDAKNFFLTYSNVEQQGWTEFTKDDLLTFLSGLDGVHYAITCKELHESGDVHFHALVKFEKKKNLRNERYFDFNGVHPNIQGCRNVPASILYIKKDNDYVERGGTPSENLIEICSSMDRLQWLQYCIGKKISYAYCDEIWKTIHLVRPATIEEGEEIVGTMCPRLQEFRYDGPLSLVLVGAAGTGKTTWAKTFLPKPILFVTHIDRLRDYDPSYHRSILFDDMDFNHLPRTAQIELVDRENPRDIHRRYGITNIPAGVPKCFTGNNRMFIDDEAVNRRIRLINLVSLVYFLFNSLYNMLYGKSQNLIQHYRIPKAVQYKTSNNNYYIYQKDQILGHHYLPP